FFRRASSAGTTPRPARRRPRGRPPAPCPTAGPPAAWSAAVPAFPETHLERDPQAHAASTRSSVASSTTYRYPRLSKILAALAPAIASETPQSRLISTVLGV